MSNRQDKALSLLGLAARGRNLTSGEAQVLDAIRSGEALLVVVAEDASDNTRKLFRDKCAYYEVPFREYATKNALGEAIGREYRSSVCVTEPGLAEKIQTYIDTNSGN
ncbi:MAG: ribosomal L7Ae/L30e/S12e/Gadd45 family protein [Lachnospiraceae bacterium]|jgi:ribosomal protein L7Ae-like RNA K-turn-binding protein|nr:ribosomal L7Ae/L30e/S12e/Gadd45 family protein [Lachnospiraceae bacterium]MCR5426821.1 ribosomal L7Ae/L30e/S12e/Gadd45 family protein [Lachnospiraceae bacterium]